MKSLNEFKEENLEKLLEYTTSNFDSEKSIKNKQTQNITQSFEKVLCLVLLKTAKDARKKN